MLARNWKHQWLLLCLAKLVKNNKNCGSGASNKNKSKLECILKASESTRLRMGESLPNHHEDHIAGKGDNSLQHYNLVHKFIPMPQAIKNSKSGVDTQVKMEDAPKLLKIPKSECLRHLDSSTTTQMAWIMVQYGRPSRSSWAKSVWHLDLPQFGRTVMGKQFEKILLQHGWEKVFQIGNAYSYPAKGDCSYLCMWMTSNLLERNKTLIRCGKYSTKKSIWENQHLSLIMFTWGCTQRQCEMSKDIVDNYRAMFESRISAGETEKLPCSENFRISSWSYDMEGHAKKYVWNDIVS